MERKIVDFHAHAFHDKIAIKAAKQLNEYYDIPLAENGLFFHLKQSMLKNKIDKLVIHATATKPSQVELINDYVKSLTSKDIVGFGTLHYAYSNYEKELDRIEEMGLRGIKFHPVFQGFKIDDEKMFPIYERLEGRFPVLIHVGDKHTDASTPKRLIKMLESFPKMTVIAAHMGGYSEWDEAEKYIIGNDKYNIYVDTSSSIRFLEPSYVAELIRRHGSDKVLFGTDYPLSLHQFELEVFDKIGLTDDEAENILWKNAYKLLEL
ncbi:MAG: amidohydrolase family protein [Clostridia bacterium]|nr:amidohydrolase family protein [Clostridia bacterium]